MLTAYLKYLLYYSRRIRIYIFRGRLHFNDCIGTEKLAETLIKWFEKCVIIERVLTWIADIFLRLLNGKVCDKNDLVKRILQFTSWPWTPSLFLLTASSKDI